MSLITDHPAILHGLYMTAVRRDDETTQALDSAPAAVADDYVLLVSGRCTPRARPLTSTTTTATRRTKAVARARSRRGEAKQARRLRMVLALVAGASSSSSSAGAIVAESVVLQADALHLLMDVLALRRACSRCAWRCAGRRRGSRSACGAPSRWRPSSAPLLVLATTAGIVFEGIGALHGHTPPRGGVMIVVATIALFVNGLSAWLLHDSIGHAHGHAHDHGQPGGPRPRPTTTTTTQRR